MHSTAEWRKRTKDQMANENRTKNKSKTPKDLPRWMSKDYPTVDGII